MGLGGVREDLRKGGPSVLPKGGTPFQTLGSFCLLRPGISSGLGPGPRLRLPTRDSEPSREGNSIDKKIPGGVTLPGTGLSVELAEEREDPLAGLVGLAQGAGA